MTASGVVAQRFEQRIVREPWVTGESGLSGASEPAAGLGEVAQLSVGDAHAVGHVVIHVGASRDVLQQLCGLFSLAPHRKEAGERSLGAALGLRATMQSGEDFFSAGRLTVIGHFQEAERYLSELRQLSSSQVSDWYLAQGDVLCSAAAPTFSGGL
jgi:hypothetical protein